ncbi:MAG TPA: hypothetical protein VFO55_11175 [Gemmatimonadaceae bacterium]|nr:hypothetical protein [Gemmatimonadaceae bacterium]
MPDSAPASPVERAQVIAIRDALLALHKVLLETERVRYERINGRITDMFQLLNLTIHDPAFAWLRPLSALIVEIDEQLDDKEEPLTSDQASATRAEVRVLLTPSQVGPDFQRNYHWALQESPDAVIAHSAAIRSLTAP